ncbi:HD-GYP domain-containing protein [Azospirillum thermophilum]|uniref:HD-GYP domain-containing protein n=1 Tax=Azospirillum thermophilum TaxID=2202148 RepID=UPI003CCBDC7A
MLHRAQEGTLAALADLAERAGGEPEESRSGSRFERSLRIAAVTERLARRLHQQGFYRDTIDEPFLGMVGLAAILHDVGNATVEPAILGKSGPLDESERAAMQKHTLAGATLLDRASRLAEDRSHLHLGAEIARSHHENWDGSGYPDGLRGERIPLSARIVAVADAYDAITRDRPYRPARSHQAAVEDIRRLSGIRYDPRVVDAFLDIAEEL